MTTDNRVTVQVDIEDDILFKLMLMAHEQDITHNQLVENILREFIERESAKQKEQESSTKE